MRCYSWVCTSISCPTRRPKTTGQTQGPRSKSVTSFYLSCKSIEQRIYFTQFYVALLKHSDHTVHIPECTLILVSLQLRRIATGCQYTIDSNVNRAAVNCPRKENLTQREGIKQEICCGWRESTKLWVHFWSRLLANFFFFFFAKNLLLELVIKLWLKQKIIQCRSIYVTW